MSSPRSIGGPVREGTRVVLREITASLHNSPPMHSARRKSGNDTSLPKTAEHEVKVRFAREFADVGSIPCSAPESLSSASSFHSISSTLSTKSSSGICADSVPLSPNEISNASYVDSSIPGVEDLILACADIHLDCEDETSFSAHQNSQDLSQDQTFTSATDEPVADIVNDFPEDISIENIQNITAIADSSSTIHDSSRTILNRTQDIDERPIVGTICIKDPLSVVPYVPIKDDTIVLTTEEKTEEKTASSPSKDPNVTCDITNDLEDNSLPHCIVDDRNLNSTVCLSPNTSTAGIIVPEDKTVVVENISIVNEPSIPQIVICPTINSAPSISQTEIVQELSLPSLSSLIEESDIKLDETGECILKNVQNQSLLKSHLIEEKEKTSDSHTDVLSSSSCNTVNVEENCTKSLNDSSKTVQETPQKELEENLHKEIENTSDNIVFDKSENPPERTVSPIINSPILNEEQDSFPVETVGGIQILITESSNTFEGSTTIDLVEKEEQVVDEEQENLSDDKLDATLTLQDVSGNSETGPEIELYTEFQPQRQSTTLASFNEQPSFDELKFAAETVANDIFKSALELSEETDHFASATSKIFEDPKSFDYLLTRGNSKTISRLGGESLYVKFDPLVSNINMLPQGNIQPTNQEQNGKNENPLPNEVGTPKRNPAIAAIDRLLFYSPLSTSTIQKMEEPQEKIEQPTEESKPDSGLIVDINMSKELELVRATVLQLEEELEKQKKEYEVELERQKTAFQEKINKLQAQIAQEVKSKSQMTVVVEEYEKSISRLLTERERDRTNFEQEKAKVQEELQATNVHLTNTEAAFNDVHQKYERLKGVVSAYKSNETVLKESIQENMETIKGLETRYDQLKNHAMTQLEKANFELDAMRKQHEDETVKLHAMVRKAELKSNSLAEMVEQKTKENKELAQILDEVIARVGHQNAE